MTSRKRRVLVTGVARWWGALLVQRLLEDPGFEEVVGIDTDEPHHDLGDADFLKLDIRHSLVGKLVRAVGIDTVVHTQTTIDSFDQDPRRAHETNVIGTLNLLAGLAGDDTPVRRLVLKSSAHVYGSNYRLPGHLGEDHPLDSASTHSFLRDIVETESNVSDFGIRNPQITAVSLRFANTLNSDEPAPLARYLDLPVVPTVLGYDPVIQLLDRDDAIEALLRATVSGPVGAYNIAADNGLPISTLLDGVGKMHAPLLPPIGGGMIGPILRQLGINSLSPQLFDLLRWGRTLDTRRAKRELGFAPKKDTAAALDEYTQQRRVLQFLGSGRRYTYERELEDYIHARRTRRRSAGGPTLRVAAEPETWASTGAPGPSAPRPHRRR